MTRDKEDAWKFASAMIGALSGGRKRFWRKVRWDVTENYATIVRSLSDQ